jgi:hypothetical protein
MTDESPYWVVEYHPYLKDEILSKIYPTKIERRGGVQGENAGYPHHPEGEIPSKIHFDGIEMTNERDMQYTGYPYYTKDDILSIIRSNEIDMAYDAPYWVVEKFPYFKDEIISIINSDNPRPWCSLFLDNNRNCLKPTQLDVLMTLVDLKYKNVPSKLENDDLVFRCEISPPHTLSEVAKMRKIEDSASWFYKKLPPLPTSHISSLVELLEQPRELFDHPYQSIASAICDCVAKEQIGEDLDGLVSRLLNCTECLDEHPDALFRTFLVISTMYGGRSLRDNAIDGLMT